MKICIVAGARPNFIKVAPLVRAIEQQKARHQQSSMPPTVDYDLIYTGNEQDPTLESQLFENLGIARPTTFLGVDSTNLNELTGLVMAKFELYLKSHPANVVVVVDDLASTMAVSIVTKKQGITLAHIAAGTRSFDITMPKEINRLVIDGLSDLLFTAGISNNSIANKEGAELSKVYMVGNILIDNLRFNHKRMVQAQLPTDIQALVTRPYLVFTLNRKALLANKENLLCMLSQLIAVTGDTPIIAPLRAQAMETIAALGLHQGLNLSHFHIIPSLGYLEFGHLAAGAKGIITDSGNVAEEATFYQVPCITLNNYTEHIETVKVGTNMLVGEDAAQLTAATKDMLNGHWKKGHIPDRWDGRSGERILQILIEHCQ